MKETDMWETPKWLMSVFNYETRQFVDRCPSNPIEPNYDSLKVEWINDSYVNPPYSNPLPFILKGIEEHKKNGILVVFLLKVDTTTKWYKALVDANAHFLYFAERLRYSESKDVPPFSSMLVILSNK